MWAKTKEIVKNIPPLFYILLGVMIAIGIAWAVLPMDMWMKQFNEWIKALGAVGYIAFFVIYVLATVALAPGAPLSIAGGLAFQWWGFPLVLGAAITGATLAFLSGRYLARSRVEKMAEDYPKFKAVDSAVAEEGWKIVMLVRLSPVVPFNLQNYFFGSTEVTFLQYVWATAVGIIPGTAVYVYLGAAGASGGGGALKWTLLGVGLIATVAVTWFVSKKANEKLAAHGLAEGEQNGANGNNDNGKGSKAGQGNSKQ